MRRQPFLVELPILEEAAVPQVEPAVAGEHADRFEQIVERRRADAQQGVARRGEAQLLGPVLEEQPQAAVGQRLGDHPDVIAVGQHPFFLDHLVGAGEPAAPLVLPRREVARFGQPLLVAHPLDHAVELGPFGEPFGVELAITANG